jgi:hypothetical protein
MIRWTPLGGPYAIVVEATSERSLLALALTLVDVAASVATAPIVVDVSA